MPICDINLRVGGVCRQVFAEGVYRQEDGNGRRVPLSGALSSGTIYRSLAVPIVLARILHMSADLAADGRGPGA
jgi:hypothetical protein